jgi:hypothetical protein
MSVQVGGLEFLRSLAPDIISFSVVSDDPTLTLTPHAGLSRPCTLLVLYFMQEIYEVFEPVLYCM